MGAGYSSGKVWLFGSVLALALPVLAPSGHATTQDPKKASTATHTVAHPTHTGSDAHHTLTHAARPSVHQASTHAVSFQPLDLHQATLHHAALHLAISRLASSRGPMGSGYRVAGISCVPYARNATGITLAGNAWQWWDHAAGAYQRGWVPEPGGVLAFRANGRMRMGHVAVVTRVINPREIEIDHANWAGRGVALSVPVVDVSENNDWTAVRVGLGPAIRLAACIRPTASSTTARTPATWSHRLRCQRCSRRSTRRRAICDPRPSARRWRWHA